MKETVTLWLASAESGKELVAFLKAKNVPINVRYVPAVNGEKGSNPILFTSLGTFEGESAIMRAAEAFP